MAGTLMGWGFARLVDDVVLLTSELATNACVHAGPPIGVALRLDEHTVRVEVHDTNPTLPQARQAGEADEQGRGLAILAALTAAWGAHATTNGKTVWFELLTG